MTLSDINKTLKSSFKNGFYIRRATFVDSMNIFINKEGKTWHVDWNSGTVSETELMNHELSSNDWEIV